MLLVDSGSRIQTLASALTAITLATALGKFRFLAPLSRLESTDEWCSPHDIARRCTWRHVQTTSVINASCMYDRIDVAIEQHDPDCFSQCPPNNRSTDCYQKCYYESSLSMTVPELTAPWPAAITREGGGCPQVNLSGVSAPAHHKPTTEWE